VIGVGHNPFFLIKDGYGGSVPIYEFSGAFGYSVEYLIKVDGGRNVPDDGVNDFEVLHAIFYLFFRPLALGDV
jgi:hypothetical protein